MNKRERRDKAEENHRRQVERFIAPVGPPPHPGAAFGGAPAGAPRPEGRRGRARREGEAGVKERARRGIGDVHDRGGTATGMGPEKRRG